MDNYIPFIHKVKDISFEQLYLYIDEDITDEYKEEVEEERVAIIGIF